MSKKLDELIKSLKKAKEILNKDDVDEKIKAKMMTAMTTHGMTGTKIADHYRDIDETIPAKQRSNIKNSLKVQEAKTAAVKKLKVVKEEEPEVKKSALDLADSLIKSLSSVSGVKADDLNNRRNVNGQKSGWTQDPKSGAFHHKIHGVVSTIKEPNGKYSVRHGGKVLGSYDNVHEAGAKVKDHMNWLGSFKSKTAHKGEEAVDGDVDPVYKGKTAAEKAEHEVMQKLAKTVGSMMPQNAKLQPTQAEFEAAMVAQGIAFTPEQLEKMDNEWGNTMTDFFKEASKPISQRFNSEEDEAAYWANIKVRDGGDNGPGY